MFCSYKMHFNAIYVAYYWYMLETLATINYVKHAKLCTSIIRIMNSKFEFMLKHKWALHNMALADITDKGKVYFKITASALVTIFESLWSIWTATLHARYGATKNQYKALPLQLINVIFIYIYNTFYQRHITWYIHLKIYL